MTANSLYEERNKVVVALAKLSGILGFSSGIRKHEPENDDSWDPEWTTVLIIDLPTGQVSWHFHDSQIHLLEGIPKYIGSWDGHTAGEKYKRLADLNSCYKCRSTKKIFRTCLNPMDGVEQNVHKCTPGHIPCPACVGRSQG